jgi:UDP-N-acetylglucosamine 2-epimerase (non-hydrolysing)
MLKLLDAAWLVLTDSGGLQEEAPSFGKPVLVLRDRTERVEGVSLGIAKLIGTNATRIVSEVSTLLQNREAYDRLTPESNPYGDGAAADRIVECLARFVATPLARSAA